MTRELSSEYQGDIIVNGKPVRAPEPTLSPVVVGDTKHRGISEMALAALGDSETSIDPFKASEPVIDGVIGSSIAMDSLPTASPLYSEWGLVSGSALPSLPSVRALGYPLLSLLAQDPIIRAIVETLADEMVRKWCELKYTGDETGEDKKVAEITDTLKALKIEKLFRDAKITDGFMGGAMLFIDMGDDTDTDAGMAEVKTRLTISKEKVRPGSFKGLRLIEPLTCYPAQYNTTNPMAPHFYDPQTWWVMGKEVHASRLLKFVSNPVPMLLKPAYSFFGISMAQMALDFVERFTTVRVSVAEVVRKFSLSILSTDMTQVLEPAGTGDGLNAGDQLKKRALMFRLLRDNDGLMVIDKEKEDYTQINTPLSGLHDIMWKQFELIAAVARTPAVKLLGISPSGFSTGDTDIRNWYDQVLSQQEKSFTDPLKTVIDLIQLSRYGEIDPSVTFEWVPLYEMDALQAAEIRKSDCDTDCAYIDRGVIAPEESRKRLRDDPKSGYNGIDADDLPEMPDDDAEDLLKGLVSGAKNDKITEGKVIGQDSVEFKESDHPRKDNGEFGSGGKGSSESKSMAELLKNGTYNGAEIISSQDFIDDDTVAEKSENKDYSIQLSPEFDIEGKRYRVLLDGHHSLRAAIQDNVMPDISVQSQQDNDKIALLENGDIDGFLEQVHQGDEFRNRITNKLVF